VSAHNRKLKVITFTLGGNSFECQLTSWQIVNNTADGEKMFTYCPDGEFIEASEPDFALELKFAADWRSGGVSDFLTLADETDVAFQLDHLYDIPGEHVRWTGVVHVKAPTVGGDARTTEMSEVKLRILGDPVYARIS